MLSNRSIASVSFAIFKNLFLAFIIGISLAGINQLFLYWHQQWINESVNFPQIFIPFLIGFLISFLKHSKIAMIICGLMIFSLFIQLVHFSYFGVRIYPIEISLFFTHQSEAMANFNDLLRLAVAPAIICLGALVIVLLAFWLCKSRLQLRFVWILLLIVFLYPMTAYYGPLRHHKIGNSPHTSFGDRPNINDDLWYSTQKLLVFYFSYTLPHEIFHINRMTQWVDPPLADIAHPDVNIIFIQGESLTWQHMGVFGYHRPTTPYLNSIKNDPNVVLKKGISSGVSTDISVPEFFNMVWKPDGTREIASLNRNLFKMAQMNGFDTHFISVQYDKWFGVITGYLYPAFINHFKILGKSIYYVPDETLVQYIANTDLSKKNFLVVQMGGSHTPYNFRYPPQFDIYQPTPNASFRTTQIDTYDNTVLHTDFIIKNIINTVQANTTKPTYVIFTSDHGESLGARGIFGHNNVRVKQEHEVPILIVALHGANLNFMKTYNQQAINSNYMSHYDLSGIISYLMGYKITQFATQHRGYFVTGPILNGFGGFDHIMFDGSGKLHDHLHR